MSFSRFRHHAFAAALCIALCAFAGAPAPAQMPTLPGAAGDRPIEIEADNGIEWQQDANAYVARGNARARQGDVVIRADTLTAHYRQAKSGGTEVWRFDAAGGVKIDAPGQTVYGDNASYHIDKGVLVLRGKALKLVAGDDVITARDSMEYWEKRSLAVARGDVTVKRENTTINADILTARFGPGEGKSPKVREIDVDGHVKLTSPCETVQAKRGVYQLATGVVKLYGSVKIVRGESQLDGEYGDVNLKTGVSRLTGGGGARGVINPADLKGGKEGCADAVLKP